MKPTDFAKEATLIIKFKEEKSFSVFVKVLNLNVLE